MKIKQDNNSINIGKSAAILILTKAVTVLLSLVISMLLSRFRTIEEYGTYSQIMIVVSITTTMFTLGLPNSINFFLARADSPIGRRNFLSVYYTSNTMLCLIMGLFVVLIIPHIEAYFNNSEINCFSYFLFIYPWTVVTISSISNVLIVYNKTKVLMLINIVTSFVTLFSVLVVKLLGLGFKEYMTALLITQVGITLWIYLIVIRLEEDIHPKFDCSLLKKIFIYSIPIGLASFVGILNIEIDKLMIGKLMDTQHLAFYTNAGRELPLTIVATSLTAVLLPQTAKLLKQNKVLVVIDLWGVSIQLSYIVICFFVTVCIVFAPQIVTFLYSEKYLPGVQIFRIYSLVLLWRVTYFGLILNSLGKTKLILLASVITLVLNVLMNYLFYIRLGFIGPAWATLVSIAITAIIQLFISANFIKCSFLDIFPWKILGGISIANLLWGIPTYLLIHILKLGTSTKSIIICAGFGTVAIILYGLLMHDKIQILWRKLNENS